MQCEKCGQETETLTCGGCGKTVTKMGPFCYLCGRRFAAGEEDTGRTVTAGSADNGEEIDFSSRILCSDGACIGVINEQGVCKVCGKPYTPES